MPTLSRESTTLPIAMTTNLCTSGQRKLPKGRESNCAVAGRLSRLAMPLLLLSTLLLSGGCSTIPVESPLCVPERPVLVDVSVSDQLAMKEASPTGFASMATNDLELKAHVRVLERTIHAHDEPLGDCDEL